MWAKAKDKKKRDKEKDKKENIVHSIHHSRNPYFRVQG